MVDRGGRYRYGGLINEYIGHELEVLSRLAPEEMTIDRKAVEGDRLVWDQKGTVERRPVCGALNRTTNTDEVDQHLVRSNAAGQCQRAVERISGAGDINHDKIRRCAIDGDGL